MKNNFTMKNNIELRAGKNLVESWLLRGLFLLPTLFILGMGQMWAKEMCSLTSSGDVNRNMPNYEAGYNMGSINVWFSINGASYSSKSSSESDINSDRAISASNITSGLKFNKFSVPVYCHNQWHGDACNNNGARIVDKSLVMSWKVSNPSGTEVGSGNFTTTTNVSMNWDGNGATGTWTSNTSEQNLLSGVTASTSASQTYTMDFWYKFQCHMYNSSGSDWGSNVNVWYPGNSQNFKYQFTIPKTTLTVNTSSDDGSATASSGITSSIALNTDYTLTASDITGYDFVNWTTSDGSITITSATSRTGAKVKFTSFTSATITANYAPKTTTVTLLANAPATGTVTGGGTTVTATYDAALPSFSALSCTDGWNLLGYYTTASGAGTKVINANGTFAANDGVWNRTDGATLDLYARWDKTNSLTVSAGANISSVTGSTSPVTLGNKYDISATPNSGYQFSSWTASPAANATFDDVSSASTKVTVKNGSVTVTANASEIMRTITISGGTAASTTAGVATTGSATAAAPAEGKKFTGWTLGDGVTLSGGALTDRTINFTATATSTVTANYADRASVKMYFAKPLVWGNSTFYVHTFKNGGGVSPNAAYPGVECTTTETINCVTYYTYQYYTEGDGIGGSATGNAAWDRVIFGCNDDAKKTGDLTISDGHYYYWNSETTGAASAVTDVWYIKGTMNSWGETHPVVLDCANNKGTVNIDLTKGTTYEFKVYDVINTKMWSNSTALGTGHEITATMASAETLYNDDENVMKITANVTGPYTFEVSNINTTSPKIKVTFPVSYTVNFSRTPTAAASAPTAYNNTTSAAISNGDKVLNGNSVTFTKKTANTGYTWYRWENGSGSSLGTGDTYTTTISAATTVVAKYTEDMHTVTVTTDGHGTITTPASGTPRTVSAGIATGASIAASASSGYVFYNWTKTSGSGTVTFTNANANSTTVKATSDATIQANFVDQWNINGDQWSSWDYQPMTATANANEFSKTFTLTKGTKYQFKVVKRTYNGSGDGTTDVWYGNTDGAGNKVFARGASAFTTKAGGMNNNLEVTPDVSGTYTFTINTSGSTPVITVTFQSAYTVTFGYGTGGTEVTASGATDGAISSGNYVKAGDDVTFTQTASTGYTFKGWYTTSSGSTTVSTMGVSDNILNSIAANANVYAQYTANSYTITLDVDEDHKGTIAGATTSQTIHFDETTTTVPNRPTAEQGYGLEGYFTGQNGNGTKLINGDGTWIASVAGYTDGSKKWIHDGDVTLYAYYKKATISAITLTPAATVAPSTTVTATPVISPTPTGPVIICWRLLHSNGNIMESQPTFTSTGVGNAVEFTAPAASSTYKVACILRTGSVCGAGSVIDSTTVNLQTAGDHTVTIQYKDTFNNTLQASTSLVGINPLEWSSNIVAAEIFGYTFLRWVAADGVTIKDCANDTCANETIKIKANYDGKLKAEYVQKNIIYFKNTLGWSNVYVNFMSGSYWNSSNGSGNSNTYYSRNNQMSLVDGTTDIYYYEYDCSTSAYVSFTSSSQANAANFWASGNGVNVVYPARSIVNGTTVEDDKPNDNGFYAKTPMFVPLAGQTPKVLNSVNSGKANYYNNGYWTKYTPGTGYSLKIYNAAGNALIKDIPFTSEDELMPMIAVVDLEAGTTYKFELMREGDVYYGNDNSMTYTNHGQDTPWEMSWKEGGHKCGLTTNAAGEYTFHLTYSANASSEYRLRMSYDYPIATGDYRVIYKDNVHTLFKPSAIVPKVNNGKDTVSFFIRPGDTPVMKIQQATVNSSTGVVTWSAGTDITTAAGLTSLPQDSVYNICLQMNGSGAISVENVEAYTGDFYIRVDCANNKWDNFKNADHALTYSEYSETYSDYTHYWMAHTWRNDNTNIKFVIANDYSPCISDTMIRSNYRGSDEDFVDEYGTITPEANIRFMWNRSDNTINRAYLSPAKKDGSQFLVLRGYNGGSGDKDDNLLSEADTELEGNPGDTGTNNHAGGDHCMQFTDNENWIYEALVKVKPDTYVKLFARFAITINNETELPVTYTDLYYKGDSGDNFNGSDDDSDGIPNAIKLITGSGDHLLVRVIYDFKTDRLLAAYIPSGNITEEMEINADVMFIREHQGDISQVTFSGSGAIKEIKTAYAVMRFNKWTLNNKSKEAPHSPLGVPLSRYERDLFYISFPFDVNLNEVFGFGTYGVHWIIEEYDGAGRAQKGFWQDSPTFWKFITNRNGKVLKKNVGYLLALDLDELGEDAAVWGVAENDRAELFFPSSGTMPNITNSSVTDNLPEHTCTIIRNGSDRTKADSHWNIMGVPTYVNINPDSVSFANETWKTTFGGPRFLYTWNSDDNTLTPTSAKTFTYHAMHAYTVQYYGNVTWTTSVSPSSIVARERQAPNAYEWCLEIQQDSLMIDRTYVRMTDEEEVTTGFEFGYDMSKDLNKNKAGIYSFITTAESIEMAAGNCLPLETEQMTLVPLGVTIPSTGDYTFAMPAGTSGVGVTLYDNDANVRTNLSALDYTVNLTAGDYTSRFFLEIPPVQPIHTDLEPTSDSSLKGRAQKKIIDGLLYIVRDGKMYDARGARVE